MIKRRAALLPAATVAFGVLALPPINAWPFALAFWLPLLWLAARLSMPRALVVGLLTGATFGLHLFFGSAVLSPTTLLAATAMLSLSFAVFVACAARLLQQPTLLSPLMLGGLWVALELLLEACAVPFTLAVMLAQAPALLQSAAIGGQHLVVFFLVAIQSALIAWSTQPGRNSRAYTAALLIAAFGATTAAGTAHYPPPNGAISVAAMQTDVHPFFYVHAEADTHLEYLNAHRRQLSAQLSDQPPDLVVWPEVAFARFEWRRPGSAPEPHPYAALVAGNDISPDGRQFNAVFGIDPSGEIRSRHVKNTLLPILEREYAVNDALAPHDPLPGRPGSLICFESAFPATASELARRGAQLLAISTSDTYAGPSLLSAFHASFAVVRAVETRRSVVRAANAGPSMIVQPDGRILAQLAPFTSGALEATIPLTDQPSFYSQTAVFWRGAFTLLGIVTVVIALRTVASVRTRPSWLGIATLLLLTLVATLYGQWRSVSQQYLQAHDASPGTRVELGFLNELAGAASYRELSSQREQDDLAAVVAAALRRFGIDVSANQVAQRSAQLRDGSIHKIDASALFDAYGFTPTPYDDDVTHSVMPCAATLSDGSSVLITRHAPEAFQIFAPGEAAYSTVPRAWLTSALAGTPVCIAGRTFAWDLP